MTAPGPQQPDEVYFCPTSGENEHPTLGGFDVCCDRPDQHRPAQRAVRDTEEVRRNAIASIIAKRTAPLPAEVAGTPWSLEGDADELSEIAEEIMLALSNHKA